MLSQINEEKTMYSIENLIHGLKSLKAGTEFCLDLDYWVRYAYSIPLSERNGVKAPEFVKELYANI